MKKAIEKKVTKKQAPASSQKLPEVEYVRPYWARGKYGTHKKYVFNKAFVVNRFVEFTVSMAAEDKEYSPEEIFYGLIRLLGIEAEYNKTMRSTFKDLR